MKNLLITFSIALIFTATLVHAQTKKPFAALDVFELEWASNPQISPDGSKIVYNRNGMDIMKDRSSPDYGLLMPMVETTIN